MNKAIQDIVGGVLSIILGLALLFWLIPDWVEPDADLRLPVSLLPQIVAVGFILCGAALLLKSLLSLKTASTSDDQGETTELLLNTDFEQKEFLTLLLMIVVLLIATIGFKYFHFLVIAPVLVAISMWIFGPLRPLSLILTATIGPTVIWVVATQVLGRVVP